MGRHSIYLLFGLILFCFPNIGISQHHCGFDELHQHQLANDSAYEQRIAENEKAMKKWLKDDANLQRSSETYTVPVVIHVVYADENADHNISDAQIHSAIQRLNEIYNDVDGTSTASNIEFVLAKRDPFCQPTTGIVRVDGSVVGEYASEGIDIEVNDSDGKGANRLAVTNLSRWNPEEYLNIWVVNEISDNNGNFGIQAFSSFPGTNLLYDGIVILYNALGYDYEDCNCMPLKYFTEENATLVHEVGHYLNLYHTFEGDGSGTVCPDTSGTAGDFVADTPAHIRTYSCNGNVNQCYPPGHPFESLDVAAENYMGYAAQTCQIKFTPGQVDRMRAALETSRSSLLGSLGPVAVEASEPLSAACTPQTTTGLTGNYGMGITKVQLGNLKAFSGSSFEDGGYTDNWCNQAVLLPGDIVDIEVETFGFYNEDVRVYIDYDNSAGFDADELAFSSNNKSTHVGEVYLPTDVVLDVPLRLRVISDHFQYNITGGCYAPNYGQVEDFSVVFQSPNLENVVNRGNALFLNGNGDDLETDIYFDLATQEFTIEFWCKPTGDPSKLQVLFDKTATNFSSSFFMLLWHNKIFTFIGQDVLFLDPFQKLESNNWNHIAYTWDGNIQRIYFNGRAAGIDSVDVVNPSSEPFTIGSLLKNHYTFQGQIDELRFWDTERTEQEIREFMHLTPSGQNLPQAWFHFNETAVEGQLINESFTATISDGGALQTSTANVGGTGSVETIFGLQAADNQYFSIADLNIEFTSKSDTSDITVSLQKFEPNSTEGIQQPTIFTQRMWTICQSTLGTYTADMKFYFPTEDLSDLDVGKYSLYNRSAGSDGAWELIVDGAAEVAEQYIKFSGVNKTGQFLIAKD